ncbi:esterase-like activity of phytase family protein [Burkholderiaceae bacterium DAT-1]|nr:esterase-like activity of phytase family protein [Burkholderiaceae bacterium DAT-1]
MQLRREWSFAALVGMTAALSACGGSDSSAPSPVAPVSAVFLDSAVAGLEVSNGKSKVLTSTDGGFSCQSGESLTFTAGGINFGSAPCASLITPLSLVNAAELKDDKLVNRLIALQLLDEDNDPVNGIKLSDAVKTALAGQSLDFNATSTSFNAALNALIAKLPAAYQGRTADVDRRMMAREHFEDTLGSRTGLVVSETVSQTQSLGTIIAGVSRYQIKAADSFYVPYEGTDARIKADFPKGFLPSYGSGLTFKGVAADGSLEFYGITDRGPNGDGPKVPASVLKAGATGTSDAKLFPSPSFTPSIGMISVSKEGAVLKSSMPIKFSTSINANGLPIAPGKVGNSAEAPLNDALKYDASSKTTFSDYGLDTESIVFDKARGAFWVSDEYGPFIVKLDAASGVVLKKYQPGNNAGDLPAVLAKRRANRGMEGLSLEAASGKLNGFIQSPLDDGKAAYKVPGATQTSSESIKDYAGFVRWVEFDPTTEKTRLFAYPIDSTWYASGKTGNAKLGDLVSLGNGKFIAIEQGAGVDGKVFNRLMLVEVPTNVSDIAAMGTDLEKSSMTGAAVNGVNFADVVKLKKTVLFDLNAAGWLAEKAEGLALVDDHTLALANDNDFGLKTNVYTPDGKVVEGADITKCTVDANGAMTTTAGATGCVAGNTARVTRGADSERASRLWIIRFVSKLTDLNIPKS